MAARKVVKSFVKTKKSRNSRKKLGLKSYWQLKREIEKESLFSNKSLDNKDFCDKIEEEKIKQIVEDIITKNKAHRQEINYEELKKILQISDNYEISNEELALKIIKLYFEEVARMGFKRQLTLDQVINAYFYVLARLEREEVEIKQVSEIISKNEESKVVGYEKGK